MFLKLDTFIHSVALPVELCPSYWDGTVGFEPTTHRPLASIKTLLLLVSKQNEEAHHIEPW